MKPHLLKFNLQSEHSFDVRHEKVPHFYNKWQYHPEMEMVYIIKGSGRQFIGDNIHHFKSGDMILLGSNLPHLWRNDEKFFKKDSKLRAEAIVIHFMPDCFGEAFFRLPENREIVKLFDRAGQGIRIKNNTKDKVSGLLQKLLVAKNSERIIILLQILQVIAYSKDVKPVCSKGLQFSYPTEETDRLNKIYQYILNNFSREISLGQIAKVAHISPHSFCRYFKSRIKKTFSTFLLEVRVGHACKLLAESHKSIAEVCFESGFNTFSNFNRHFKAITGTTPSAHRKYYQETKITRFIED